MTLGPRRLLELHHRGDVKYVHISNSTFNDQYEKPFQLPDVSNALF